MLELHVKSRDEINAYIYYRPQTDRTYAALFQFLWNKCKSIQQCLIRPLTQIYKRIQRAITCLEILSNFGISRRWPRKPPPSRLATATLGGIARGNDGGIAARNDAVIAAVIAAVMAAAMTAALPPD